MDRDQKTRNETVKYTVMIRKSFIKISLLFIIDHQPINVGANGRMLSQYRDCIEMSLYLAAFPAS
jgi:hypothetical protein